MLSEHVLADLLQDLVAERERRRPADPIPRERNATAQERHDSLSFEVSRLRNRQHPGDGLRSRPLFHRADPTPVSSVVVRGEALTLSDADILPIR
jgi:hypothetical protein